MSGSAWAGVDVGGRKKAFHVAFVDERDNVRLDRAPSVAACLDVLRAREVRVVAIDAPAAWAPDGELARPCEKEFVRTRLCGIRFTPNAAVAAEREDRYYEWIEHGLELWAACRSAGLVAIECFPTASWSAWLGPRGTSARAAWTKRGVDALLGDGLSGMPTTMNQDERDAVAAALTARQRDLQRESVDEFGQLIVPSRGTWPVVRGNRASTPLRGRLHDKNAAPEEGELTNDLAGTESFAVEQILSGRLAAPVAYRQDHDEWVIVIEGAAVLEVDGTEYALTGGDWFLLPANVHHRLVSTEPGTNWLAVRGTPPKPS